MLDLKKEREALGLSKKAMALALKVSLYRYCKWEKGLKPSIKSLKKIYKFFNIKIIYKIDLTKSFEENIKLKREKTTTPKSHFGIHSTQLKKFEDGLVIKNNCFIRRLLLSWLFNYNLNITDINILYFLKNKLDTKQLTLEQTEKMVCLLLNKTDLNTI